MEENGNDGNILVVKDEMETPDVSSLWRHFNSIIVASGISGRRGIGGASEISGGRGGRRNFDSGRETKAALFPER